MECGYRSLVRTLSLLIGVIVFSGCVAGGDDDDASSDCPLEDRFTSNEQEACQENFCGLPEVWPATGNSPETFRVLEAGDTIPLWFGAQGGYHLEFAARTQNLCPVIFLDFELYDITDGAETLIHSVRRHVQAVREPDADPPSLQRWWVEQFRFPCVWWPDDPNHDPTCSDEPVGRIEDADLLFRIQSEDHNENRSAVAEVPVSAECCVE